MRASAQGAGQLAGRLLAGRRPGDHLGQHRVVVRGDLAAGGEAGVDAEPAVVDSRHPGISNAVSSAALRLVVGGRVLGVEPHLDGVAEDLADGVRVERAALGDGELQGDQVDAEDAPR